MKTDEQKLRETTAETLMIEGKPFEWGHLTIDARLRYLKSRIALMRPEDNKRDLFTDLLPSEGICIMADHNINDAFEHENKAVWKVVRQLDEIKSWLTDENAL